MKKPPIPRASAQDFPHIHRALEEDVSAVYFGPLARWTQEELRALVDECGRLHELECKAIDEWYQKEQFTVANFMSAERSKKLMRMRDEAIMNSIGKTSELCGVAFLFLPGEGVDL